MHPPVEQYVREALEAYPPPRYAAVLEFGSRDVNGGLRHLLPDRALWVGVDLEAGPDVEIVGDAAGVDHEPGTWDVVLCTEVLEHAQDAPLIVANMARHAKIGGLMVITAAGPGRPPHSAIDEQPIRPWEFYRNVDPAELDRWLEYAGVAHREVTVEGADVRAVAIR